MLDNIKEAFAKGSAPEKVKPVLFLTGLQEGVLGQDPAEATQTNQSTLSLLLNRNKQKYGFATPHLAKKTRDLLEFAAQARDKGIDIVWVFNRTRPNGRNEWGQKLWDTTPHLLDDFAKAKALCNKQGEAPIADLIPHANDRFWVLPSLSQPESAQFQEQIEALGLVNGAKANGAVAVCGFEYETPHKDGVYLLAHDFASHEITPTILEDLADNREEVAHDEKAQKNIAFLKRAHKGEIIWGDAQNWLRSAAQTTSKLPPAALPAKKSRNVCEDSFSFVRWAGGLLTHPCATLSYGMQRLKCELG